MDNFPDLNPLAQYETKLLIAELRRRRGNNPVAIEDLAKIVDELPLGDLGGLKRQVDALWDHKIKLLSGLSDREKAFLTARDYVSCVKSVRERLGVGLADAKTLVDKWKGMP